MFLSFCVLDDFFRMSNNLGIGVFLIHPTVVSVLLSASVERCFVSRMRDFFIRILQVMDEFSSRRQSSDGRQEHIFFIRRLQVMDKFFEETDWLCSGFFFSSGNCR